MDLNATLSELRKLCDDIQHQEGKWLDEESQTYAEAAIGAEIAGLFEALDYALNRGAFLPTDWTELG